MPMRSEVFPARPGRTCSSSSGGAVGPEGGLVTVQRSEGMGDLAREPGSCLTPVQPARDHQVQH
jgi:hypothetical protein